MLPRGNHALVAIFALSLTGLVVRQAEAYSYVELGCAADAPGDDRVLPYGPMGIGGGDMSAEICYDLCADNYPDTEYFGTQFSWECFCGMTLPDDLSFDPEYDGCTATCAGSTDGEICGGYYAVTVYQFSDFTIEPTPVPTPSVEPAGDYVKLGCAADARGEGRVFPEGPLGAGGDMSAEICYELCIHELPGTDYFGTEFYDECFCGTTLPDGLSFDPEHDGCTTTCAGSTDGEICGGFDAITIYEIGGEAPTPVPTPDPTSGGPTIGPTPGEAPTPVPTPDPTGGGPTIGPTPVEAPTPFPTPSAEPTGDYVKLGCAVDARGDGRVLPEGPMGIGGGDMSAEICYELCTREHPGMDYFGTEFYSECFCGTTLPDGLSFDPEHDGCTTTCAGSTDGEICGGFNAITIYEMGGEAPTPVPTPDPTRDGHPTPAPPTTEVYVELGCSADPNPGPDGGRLMDAGPFRQSTMSAEICHDICMDELPYFEFFGTQWSIECFCSMAPLPDDVTFDYNGCTDTCAGSTTGEICGGTDAITVYPRWAT